MSIFQNFKSLFTPQQDSMGLLSMAETPKISQEFGRAGTDIQSGIIQEDYNTKWLFSNLLEWRFKRGEGKSSPRGWYAN